MANELEPLTTVIEVTEAHGRKVRPGRLTVTIVDYEDGSFSIVRKGDGEVIGEAYSDGSPGEHRDLLAKLHQWVTVF